MAEDSPLTGKKLRSILAAAARHLESKKESVNALNVFPVPDGDTGTNMCLTVAAAVREMDKVSSSSLGEMVRALSLGSLMGARGNSGVILSQLFRGLGKSLQERRTATALQVAWAFQEGVETAYKAVMKPVEGTILTVAREMARSALQEARKGAGLEEILEAAAVRGREVLARTPEMLPVLKEAGVVDAGGMGLLCLLEGALQGLRGEDAAGVPAQATHVEEPGRGLPAGGAAAQETAGAEPEIRYAYDTQLLIRGARLAVDRIRAQLEPLGDSLLVVGDPRLVKVHVHTNEPHRAIATCLLHGEILEASVENMREQRDAVQRERMKKASPDERPAPSGLGGLGHGAPAAVFPAPAPPSQGQVPVGPGQTGAEPAGATPAEAAPAGVALAVAPDGEVAGPGVVVVASGAGLESMFRNLGANVVVSGGQTMNPSTEDLLRAIESLPCSEVLVLPNNGNILMAARQTSELTSKSVHVVPTRSIPQGIAALVALNRSLPAEKNLVRMEQTLSLVKSGEVTRAVRDSRYKEIDIHEGDFIGLLDDEIVTVGRGPTEVLVDLVKRMTGPETEIVTVFYGDNVTAKEASRAAALLREASPGHEVEIHHGGQPLYHYLISVE